VNRWLAGLLALLLLAGWQLGRTQHRAQTEVQLADVMRLHKKCASGPWGRIVYDYSIIEMPPALWKPDQQATRTTEWRLLLASPEVVRQQLLAVHFTREQVQALLDTLTPMAGGYVLHPSDDFILNIAPEVRRAWYTWLAAEPGNPDYTLPPRFLPQDHLTWLQEAGLDAHTLAMVRKLSFSFGDLQVMADFPVLSRRVQQQETLRQLTCVLSRETTLLAYLLVGPQDNLDQLADYWGYPDRQDAVRTLLRTTQRSGFDRPIPISMLLPHFARDRVHRYWRAGDPSLPHCHFTSLNFFTDRPDEGCTNDAYAAQVLARDYVVITPPRAWAMSSCSSAMPPRPFIPATTSPTALCSPRTAARWAIRGCLPGLMT
jgi:hypothetical protein